MISKKVDDNVELLDEITTTIPVACGGRLIIPVKFQRAMGLKTRTLVEVTIKVLNKNRAPLPNTKKEPVTNPDAIDARAKARAYLAEMAAKKAAARSS